MCGEAAKLAEELAAALGYLDEDVLAVCELDPVIARCYIELAAAVAKRKVLDAKTRSLINIALSASVTDLKEKYTRIHIARALRLGATREEICEVLQLTSVLGIHGFIPGAQMLLKSLGGLEAYKQTLSGAQLADAESAKAEFLAARGDMTPIWETNAYLSPDLTAAYARYSGAPWKGSALPAKVKQFIYIAIDLAPSHLELLGAATHIDYATKKHGATTEEILAILELIVLVGFQSQLLALPILKEELAKA